MHEVYTDVKRILAHVKRMCSKPGLESTCNDNMCAVVIFYFSTGYLEESDV
jgi:hypothetical protein